MVAYEMQAVLPQCALNHLRRFPLPAEAVHMPMFDLATWSVCLGGGGGGGVGWGWGGGGHDTHARE